MERRRRVVQAPAPVRSMTVPGGWRRFGWGIVLGGLTHAVASLVVLVWAFSASLSRLESGAPAGGVEEWMLRLLTFPFVYPLLEATPPTSLSGSLGYLPFFANSLFWGSGLAWWVLSRREGTGR